MKKMEETKNSRKSRVCLSVVVVLMFMLTMLSMVPMNTQAANKPVTVVIERIVALDPVDEGANPADFYVIATVNGGSALISPIWRQANDISPYWSATWWLPWGSGQAYWIVIQIWDDDGGSGNDLCDADREPQTSPTKSMVNLVYYIDTGQWIGDDGFSGDTYLGHTSGEEPPDSSTDEDEDDCELWFGIIRGR